MPRLRDLDHPLAIAMWDSSWIRRRYVGGGFEDWDRTLDAFQERGYDAVRIDVFPQLIAAGPDGTVVDEFVSSPGARNNTYGFGVWGNAFTVRIDPRRSLVEFLGKLRERGMWAGLSTWFKPTDEGRNTQIFGVDGFVRVWDETLRFLADHDRLDRVVYVDLCNEYPRYHDNTWFHDQLAARRRPDWTGEAFNPEQAAFYWAFITDALTQLRSRWPGLDLFVSQTITDWAFDRDRDYAAFDALDVHAWMVNNPSFTGGTGYWENMHQHGEPGNTDEHYEQSFAAMMRRWDTRKDEWIAWLDGRLADVAPVARAHDLAWGNTEGWAAIKWADHPSLDWNWVKECGEIGARLGVKYGFAFNCTSNYTHPHHQGMWNDVGYHRDMTSIIRSGRIGVPAAG